MGAVRQVGDWIVTPVRGKPWRCARCLKRYKAKVAVCRLCGGTEIKHISESEVDGSGGDRSLPG